MKLLPTLLRVLLLTPIALIWGCAVSPEIPSYTDPTPSPAAAIIAASEDLETPIPKDSVYPLMAAEFALRNRDFELGLSLLIEQSLVLTDPEVARRALQLAEFVNKDRAALTAAMRLAELDTSDGAAAATAMSLLIRAGLTDRAIAYASQARNAGGRINAPALMQGFEGLSQERQNIIIIGLESIAEAYPNDPDIAIAKALLYRQLERYDAAGDALNPVFDANAYDERGLVLWTQIQIDKAAQEPLKRIRLAVDMQPDSESLRLQYARLLASNTQLDLAREQFQILKDISPRNGDYLFSLALLEYEQKQFPTAKSLLQALLALQQRVDEAWYYLGRIEELADNIAASVEAYSQVMPSREYIDANRRAASLLLGAEDSQDLATFFTHARDRNPAHAERLYSLEAELLKDAQLRSRAMAVFDAGIAAFPDSMALHYGRAMLRESQDDIPGMEFDLRTILNHDPNNATTLNALGYALTNSTNRYQEAAGLIERALALSPGDAAVLDSLGWVYFKLDRLSEARQILVQAYKLLPEPEVAAHLGEVLWALGEQEHARRIWLHTLLEDPQNPYVIDVLDRLDVNDI